MPISPEEGQLGGRKQYCTSTKLHMDHKPIDCAIELNGLTLCHSKKKLHDEFNHYTFITHNVIIVYGLLG